MQIIKLEIMKIKLQFHNKLFFSFYQIDKMASKKRKIDMSSSSSNSYADAILSSLSQSSSSRSSSSSSSSSRNTNSEKLSSSSSSKIFTSDGIELYKIKDTKFIYYDKNKKEVKLEKDNEIYYLAKDGDFYDRNKNKLNYQTYDLINKTKDEPLKILVNIEPDISASFSSVSTGYQLVDGERLSRFRDDEKIIYYDVNNYKFDPSEFEKVVYFSVNDDYSSYRYHYYNRNKRKLNYETVQFNVNKETILKIPSQAASQSSSSKSSSKSMNSNISLPKSIKSEKTPTYDLKPVDFPIMYLDYTMMNSYVPDGDNTIYYYSDDNKYYNKNKELLNYKLVLNNKGIYVAFKPMDQKDVFHFNSSSLKKWTYDTEYLDDKYQQYYPSTDEIIEYYDEKYNYYNYKKEKLNYAVSPVRNRINAFTAIIKKKSKSKSMSPILFEPVGSSSSSSHKKKSMSPILFEPIRSSSSSSHKSKSRSSIIFKQRTPTPRASSSSKKSPLLSDKTFISSSSSSPVSVNEEKIKLCSRWAFNKKVNPERPKNPTTNRNIVKNGKIYNDLNKKCKKIPVLSNAMKSSSTSSADVDSATIKTCAKWATIKQKYPNKPYNPDNKKKTPIKVGGPTYKKLDKTCKKVKIYDYKLSSSSKSSIIQDADPETIRRCNKWAAIKQKYPNEPYNPDNKKKTKIKVGGPTYKKLEKDCHKIPIDQKYKIEETPLNSKDKIDSSKLMKQCKAFQQLENKFRKNPDDPKLRKKIKEIKDKLIELKKKCPIVMNKKDKKKDIEKIILNEEDKYLCMQWTKIKKDYPDNLYNPKTKAQINKGGPTYKNLEKKCKDFKIRESDIDSIKIANPKKNLEKKVLNSALCLEWNENREVNPLTNKFIQKDGKTYKNIKKQCKEIMKKKKDR